MLSMAFLGQYLCWLSGPESVRRFEVRFVGIVRPGDVLTCRGRVKSVASKSADHEVLIQMWAENQRGEQVTVGDAEVMIRWRPGLRAAPSWSLGVGVESAPRLRHASPGKAP